jgi:hypothetical protein
MSAAAESGPQAGAARASAPCFVSLPVDFLLIGGGSILLFLLLPRFSDGTRTARIIELGTVLTWLGNWPHFAATNYRLYGARAHLRQYPVTAIAAPLLVLAGVAGSFAAPALVAPYFVKLFLIWSPFHYCGQSLGISLLYARRSGHRPVSLERFFLSAFIYGTFFTRTLLAETASHHGQYYGVEYPSFGIADWVPKVSSAWTYACAAVFVFLLLRTCLRDRRLPSPMYLLPAVTQYVWFYVAGARPGYAEFVPFFHGLQYLIIAWAMQLKESADKTGAAVTPRFIAMRSASWYATILIGGAALFHLLPLAAARGLGVSVPFASAIVLTALQIHHFFVDGVIWKLRTASVVSPLLVNIPALLQQPAPARPGLAAA